MAKKKTRGAARSAVRRATSTGRGGQAGVTRAVENLKRKAKQRGKPMTAAQIRKATAELQATVRRQNASDKKKK